MQSPDSFSQCLERIRRLLMSMCLTMKYIPDRRPFHLEATCSLLPSCFAVKRYYAKGLFPCRIVSSCTGIDQSDCVFYFSYYIMRFPALYECKILAGLNCRITNYECYCTVRFKNFPKGEVKQSPRLNCQKDKYRKVLVFLHSSKRPCKLQFYNK